MTLVSKVELTLSLEASVEQSCRDQDVLARTWSTPPSRTQRSLPLETRSQINQDHSRQASSPLTPSRTDPFELRFPKHPPHRPDPIDSEIKQPHLPPLGRTSYDFTLYDNLGRRGSTRFDRCTRLPIGFYPTRQRSLEFGVRGRLQTDIPRKSYYSYPPAQKSQVRSSRTSESRVEKKDNDPEPVYDLAKALMTLQRAFGTIPRIIGKGSASRVKSHLPPPLVNLRKNRPISPTSLRVFFFSLASRKPPLAIEPRTTINEFYNVYSTFGKRSSRFNDRLGSKSRHDLSSVYSVDLPRIGR